MPAVPTPRIRFVFYHAFRNGPDETLAMIAMAVRSVHRAYPGAAVTLLTNAEAKVLGLGPGVEIRAIAPFGDELMLSRIEEYRRAARASEGDDHLVFIDTDILVVRRFDELLAGDADLVVTVRDWEDQPINGGFYVANMARRAEVLAFFDAFVAHYRTLPAGARAWSGDQIALQSLLEAPRLGRSGEALRSIAGLRVRYVPVRVYNNTPGKLALRLGLHRPGARLLHFKGPRKAAMPRYFRRYVRA